MHLFSADCTMVSNIFFAHKKLKKPPKKVAYLSRNSVVSEIFPYTAQQPKWQNICSQMWPIEQLYIELGTKSYEYLHILLRLRLLKCFVEKEGEGIHTSVYNQTLEY